MIDKVKIRRTYLRELDKLGKPEPTEEELDRLIEITLPEVTALTEEYGRYADSQASLIHGVASKVINDYQAFYSILNHPISNQRRVTA